MGPGPPDDRGGADPWPRMPPRHAADSREPETSHSTRCGPHESVTRAVEGRLNTTVTTPSDAQSAEGPVSTEGGTKEETPVPGSKKAATQGTGGLRGSYATAVRHGGKKQQSPKMPLKITGHWKPRERDILMNTLALEWTAPEGSEEDTETALLRKVAMAQTDIRHDDILRERTEQETTALLAYLNGALELPHAPNFLKATMPVLQRAMMEQFHEAHVEKALTADVSPKAKLRRNMTHHALFGLLYQANADSPVGQQMIRRMMDDVKMLHFDGIHTLTFVFHSSRMAAGYTGIGMRLQGQFIELEDSAGSMNDKILRPAQLRRRYAIRVYHMEQIGLVTLLATLGRLPGVDIVDAERPRVDSTEVIDNRYVTIHFNSQYCPAPLRSVTKIELDGDLVTVHHHLIHPRLPCTRCYAPYHTAGFCKTKPPQLERMKSKHLKSNVGALPNFKVGEAVQYRHTDGDSLATFLTTLQQEVEAELGPLDVVSLETPRSECPDADSRTRPSDPSMKRTDANRQSRGASAEISSLGTPDAGGYSVAQSKAAKSRAERNEKRQQDTPTAQASKMSGLAPNGPDGPATGKPGNPKSDNKGTEQRPQGYASFNRDRARGRYAVLADQDRDDEDAGSSRDSAAGDDDAPYAFVPEMDEATDQHSPAKGTGNTQMGGSMETPNAHVDNMEVDSGCSSLVSGYVGSSAPSQPTSAVSTPGSEFPYSLASEQDDLTANWTGQPDVDVDEIVDCRRQPGQGLDHEDGQAADDSEEAAGSGQPSLSQEGFTMEQTVYPTGMPQQLPVFTRPFGGTLIQVPSNGQCAYTALYATTSYVEGGALHFTNEVVRNSNAIKRSIYTLMMSNLAVDVECGIVEPHRELQRLYPDQLTPTEKTAATATLYAHYAQERARSVNTAIPSDFWAGAEVLRAMAQYLREPLFVFDVDAHNDTHVQRYYYQNYETPNGDSHESGCGGAMDDDSAKKMLLQYARLHVLPVMMVIKRHEGHFYGMHHGAVSARWLAEGDRQFAMANCSTYPWYEEIMTSMEYSRTQMPNVDVMDESDAVEAIIIGGLEHRDRLDVVHDRLGLQRLNKDGFDIAALDATLGAEGDRLQKKAATLISTTADATSETAQSAAYGLSRRHQLVPQGRVALAPMQRILDSIEMEPELVADRSKLRQLLQVNAAAVEEWCQRTPAGGKPEKTHTGPRGLIIMMPWFMAHRDALHSLFSFLPYPELAAKQLPIKILRQWGHLEAYDVRVATLRGILHDPNASQEAAEHCRTWLAACTLGGGGSQDRIIAGEPHRWARLQQMWKGQISCSKPDNIPTGSWAILHTLPYTVWTWRATAIGGLANAHLGQQYNGQPAIRKLCELADQRAEWGTAVAIPSGLTWEDRITSMEAGLPAHHQY